MQPTPFNQQRQGVAKQLLLIFLLALTSTLNLQAQAFDGDADRKYLVGYHNIGGTSGAELLYDRGVSDDISLGMRTVFVNRVVKYDGERDNEAGMDLGVFANYHFMDLLKLPDNLDLIAGAGISLLVFDVHAGIRYNFSEVVGVYAEARQNIFSIIKESDDRKPLFQNKSGFSIGLTFNF